MSQPHDYSRYQFILFRFLTGLLLAAYMVSLNFSFGHSPYWAMVFPPLEIQSLVTNFPNILNWLAPTWLGPLAAIFALLAAFGFQRRFSTSVVFYLWACFHYQGLVLITPVTFAILFLLVIMMIVPEQERRAERWNFSRSFFMAAQCLLIFYYCMLINIFDLSATLRAGVLAPIHWGEVSLTLIMSLGILSLVLRQRRYIFWCFSLALLIISLFRGIGLVNLWFLWPLHILALDPRWWRPESTGILFYDGQCGLCHGLVRFVLEVDARLNFTFSRLQSPYALKLLPTNLTSQLETVVYLKQGKLYTHSQAVFQLLYDLGGLWTVLGCFKFLPSRLFDPIYLMVSRRRHQWQMEVCPLPEPELAMRFKEHEES